MDSENIEKIIFYSWQSDLPSVGNHYLIRDALRGAIRRISRDDTELKIRVDHDTFGVSGSPDIKQVIFDKIDQCTVFVCDISIINQNDNCSRPVPNPNVLIEMGYAAAKLGWARIILVFNEHYGKLEDLPFDIRANRISKYNFNPVNASGENKNKVEEHLENIFSVAVRSILESEYLEKSNTTSDIEEIRRARDIKTLKKVLYTTYIPVIDEFFGQAKKGILNEEVFTVFYALNGVVSSSDFYLYDQNLMQMTIDFLQQFE